MRPLSLQSVILGVVFCACLPLLGRAPSAAQSPGSFSRDAIKIWGRFAVSKTVAIKSPNGRAALMVEYRGKESTRATEINVYLKVGGRRFGTDIGSLVNSEVLWAPDSKAFAVTFSDGGDIGTYHTQIYWVDSEGFRVTEPTLSVKKAFLSQKLVCFEPEPPNIGVIEWLGSSQKILLAAEIPPHSNCDNFGTFKAYAITLPKGLILNIYGQIEAKRLFGSHLGAELANANDNCFTRPGSCWIPQLHRGGRIHQH